MSQLPPLSAEDAAQVTEYVLGTLSLDERIAFEARLESEPALSLDVRGLEQKLAPLAAVGDEVTPSPGLFAKIESAIAGQGTVSNLTVIEGGKTGRDNSTASPVSVALVWWRRSAIGMGAIAAALLVALVGTQLPQQGPQSYVAVVDSNGAQPPLIVHVDLRSGTVLVRPALASVASDKSLELWYIGANSAPKSMGVVENKSLDLKLPADANKSLIEKAVFAVTLEPKGGSPTGKPTGPVVYKGTLIPE
ncbi:MAG: anti-sigma factor [Hyphomicrobiales bacterium]|nr:anti-sigma factor [Hyphomicrobiales bacterium]MDE2114901.1 anti-sigma factor [Hyphomicrobiales bacterium]